MRRLRAELVLPLRMGLGEGARWEDGVLRFVDYHAPAHHRFDPRDGELRSVPLAEPVAALARWGEGWVGTARTGLARVGDGVEVFAHLADGAGEWCNDARCDPRGRLWAGTATRGARAGDGSLYRLDDAGSAPVRMLGGLGMGNGIGWSPDARTLYFADSHARRVDAFDYDLETGAATARRELITVADGLPDGLAVDAEGGIWLAVWGAGAVRRYTPDGSLDAAVELPARNVTSVALAPDALYVVSATEDDEATPEAGALFRCDVGVGGLPEAAFAG